MSELDANQAVESDKEDRDENLQEVKECQEIIDSEEPKEAYIEDDGDAEENSRPSRDDDGQNAATRESTESCSYIEEEENHAPGDQTSLVQSSSRQQYSTFPQGPDDQQDERGCCGISFIMLRVYTSHGLSSWGDRMWTFAVGLFLIILYPNSLQLSASYGLSSSLSVILFGELVGRWIDKAERLKAACIALVIQNGSIALCAGLVVLCFQYKEAVGGYIGLLYAAVIVMAVVAHLSSVAQKIIMEKDWIVVIANNDNNKLAAMNAVFRTLDLATYTLAPVLVGQLMTFTSPSIAATVIAIWNLISLVVEYGLLHNIYKVLPKLARKPVIDTRTSRTFVESVKHYIEGWKIYFKQEGCFAGLGLSSLFMTVLGFDSITVGFSYSQGISGSIIGILTAAGAVFGIIGSVSYPFIRSRIGLERAGLMGFLSLMTTISLCVASVFTAGSPFDITSLKNIGNLITPSNSTVSPPDGDGPAVSSYLSISLFLSGVVLTRFGLWVADLSITQTVQQGVVEGERGVVGGIQNSLNMIMDCLKFILVILLPLPAQFGFLILLSFAFACLGWMFYAIHSRSVRGHVMPFHNVITAWRDKKEKKGQPK